MNMRLTVQLASLLATVLVAAHVRADEPETQPQPQAEAVDPDLPQPFDPGSLIPMLKQSPFSRVVDFTDTYLLTGVAYLHGQPLATLMNKETKKRYVVTSEPNAQGWRITDIVMDHDPNRTSIKLQVGPEVIAMRYFNAIPPPNTKGRTLVASNGNRRREVTPVDIHNLPESEVIRKDKDGKPYVRGSIYLPTEDRDKYYNSMSREAHDKFRQIIEDNRDKMFKYTPDQRANFAKKVFDKVNASDSGGKK